MLSDALGRWVRMLNRTTTAHRLNRPTGFRIRYWALGTFRLAGYVATRSDARIDDRPVRYSPRLRQVDWFGSGRVKNGPMAGLKIGNRALAGR